MSTMHTTSEKIVLEGDLILKNIEKFRNLILPKTEVISDLIIELRDVQKWDVAGIQLLYSCRRHFALFDKDISFVFTNQNDAENGQEWISLINNNL